MYLKAKAAASKIKEFFAGEIETAVVLGSGLGNLCEILEDKIEIPFSEIPDFPLSRSEGHQNKFVIGKVRWKTVLFQSGRVHFYEGFSMEEAAFPVRVMHLLGIKNLVLTNSAGGLNKAFNTGDLMIITDHINFSGFSPLRGKNEEKFGPRFPDMTEVYSKKLREKARGAAQNCGISIKEGVYFYMTGPAYETPAEIKAIAALGGNAVGMSTVPEAVAARHCGMEVLGISCIANMAAGLSSAPLSHGEVIETAEAAKENFKNFIYEILC